MASELDKFLEERSNIPIPNGDAAWVKLLAKEVALGIHRQLWSSAFLIALFRDGVAQIEDSKLESYLRARWQDHDVSYITQLLKGHGYLEYSDGSTWLTPTEKAYELVDVVEPFNIFISYRRLDSSALALLVLARLKEHSLVPFVDMALQAGGNWHADLEERIESCDYFIILLGKDTLSSTMTVKEIQWAIQYKKTIIPLWHSGFNLNDEKWAKIDGDVNDAIQQTNAIIVQGESAKEYNSAIVELLNRFGVTP